MERPSHIIFDTSTHTVSRRLPLLSLALCFQASVFWLFTHGLMGHFIPTVPNSSNLFQSRNPTRRPFLQQTLIFRKELMGRMFRNQPFMKIRDRRQIPLLGHRPQRKIPQPCPARIALPSAMCPLIPFRLIRRSRGASARKER